MTGSEASKSAAPSPWMTYEIKPGCWMAGRVLSLTPPRDEFLKDCNGFAAKFETQQEALAAISAATTT